MRKPPAELVARLLDSLADIFTLVLDKERRIIYANAPFLEHFNLGWEEVKGRWCFELVSPFTAGESPQLGFCPTELGPFYPERTLLTREIQGKKFVYEVTFYHLADGAEDTFTVCVFKDVTARYHLESQVRQLDELERTLVRTAMDGIVVNDLAGNILIFNEGAAKILGYAPEEVIGKVNVSELYPPRLAHEIKEKVYSAEFDGAGLLHNYETLVRHKDGTLVPIWLSARVLHEDGQEMGIVGYFRDLRERKRLEEELLQNERLATLGKMLAHITHEIKNPLMLIGGFARQCAREPELSEEARRKLQLIRAETQRLEKFLGDLSSFTRITPTSKTPGDLAALIKEVAEMMEANFKESGVHFQVQAPQELPAFPFDAGQIRQVLINLFKNALEAMPQGGQLLVSVELHPDSLILRVSDSGHGIAPEHQKMLFSPFFSTKPGGSGLGLTICRQLIEQHQGEIQIDSEINRGTTCRIRLPLHPSERP
jgi:PAS domain S-box-containing protein